MNKSQTINRAIGFLIGILIFVSTANASLNIASVLGNNMVLQRNSEIKLWGTAEANTVITIKTTWNKELVKTLSNANGEWMAKLKTIDAGGPYSISIKTKKEKIELSNILLGEVWLCSGQSNMEMPVLGFGSQPVLGSGEALMNANNQNIRLFTVKKAAMPTPQDTCGGQWLEANAQTVGRFSAVGYFYARLLQQKLNVPIGIISSSVGGTPVETWMGHNALAKFPDILSRSSKYSKEQDRASHLYNGMIKPIVNFNIKGAIWYQGEANRTRHAEYASLLSAMVSGWRADFGVGEFPFYYVQIAPYAYGDSKGLVSVYMRDEQLKAMNMIANSGMVCTLDLGSELWIHPAQKETIANRLAGWALAETYGSKGVFYKSPTFKSIEIKDSVVTVSFNNSEFGITTFDKSVDCFEVAGEDKVFYPAKMTKMHNDFRKVEVSSDKVKRPVALRYAYSNFPKTDGYLYGITGLPVPSFRTDNWE